MKETTDTQLKPITICMGSSCYARGNAYNVELIQTWLKAHGLDVEVELGGTLCEGRCREGPILRIGDTVYTKVTPASVNDILGHEYSEKDNG